VIVRYRQRDHPHVEPLIEHILDVLTDVCTTLDCPPEGTLEIGFSPADAPPHLVGHVLTLPSPWLSGIPLEGGWDQATLDELAYWATYRAAAQSVRSAANDDLNRLQKAILDEYAASYSQRTLAQAPILRRVVERHGIDALPALIRSLKEMSSTSQFLAQWLFLSDPGADYFETVLNLGCEAIRAGRRDTFLLFQDYEPRWMALQAKSYDRALSEIPFLAPSPRCEPSSLPATGRALR